MRFCIRGNITKRLSLPRRPIARYTGLCENRGDMNTWRKFIEWLGGHGALVLSVVLLVCAGVWGFVELLDRVLAGRTEHFDTWAVKWMGQFHGPGYSMLEE